MALNYCPNTNALKKLLLAALTKGVPPMIDDKYLLQSGLLADANGKLSTNAKRVRKVLVAMNFIDSGFVPTDLWTQVRTDNNAFLKGLTNLYPDESSVLSSYEDADDNELFQFFKGDSQLGDNTIKMCVATFKTIRDAAIIGKDSLVSSSSTSLSISSSNSASRKIQKNSPTKKDTNNQKDSNSQDSTPLAIPSVGPQIVVNIQLQVPEDLSGEVYEKFFQSMKKHLYPDA